MSNIIEDEISGRHMAMASGSANQHYKRLPPQSSSYNNNFVIIIGFVLYGIRTISTVLFVTDFQIFSYAFSDTYPSTKGPGGELEIWKCNLRWGSPSP